MTLASGRTLPRCAGPAGIFPGTARYVGPGGAYPQMRMIIIQVNGAAIQGQLRAGAHDPTNPPVEKSMRYFFAARLLQKKFGRGY